LFAGTATHTFKSKLDAISKASWSFTFFPMATLSKAWVHCCWHRFLPLWNSHVCAWLWLGWGTSTYNPKCSCYISELLVADNFSWLIYSSEDNPDFLRVGFLWKQVEDRGKAIKGPKRIDLYHRSHREALQWGRRKLQVFFSHL
jgi:hypothetical protein